MQSRFFATAAAQASVKSAPLIPAPLNLTGPAGVYTSALWSAANEQGEKDKVARDAKVFLEAVKGKEFSNFIANPFVPKKNRIENITPMLHKMGFCKTSLGFVKALIAKNRLKGAPVVFSKYLQLVEAAEGKVEGVVTTAEPLTDKQFAELSRQLDGMTKKVLGANSQRVELTRKVDKSILSGLHVKFGSYELDLTGRTYMHYSINRLIDAVVERASMLEADLARIQK